MSLRSHLWTFFVLVWLASLLPTLLDLYGYLQLQAFLEEVQVQAQAQPNPGTSPEVLRYSAVSLETLTRVVGFAKRHSQRPSPETKQNLTEALNQFLELWGGLAPFDPGQLGQSESVVRLFFQGKPPSAEACRSLFQDLRGLKASSWNMDVSKLADAVEGLIRASRQGSSVERRGAFLELKGIALEFRSKLLGIPKLGTKEASEGEAGAPQLSPTQVLITEELRDEQWKGIVRDLGIALLSFGVGAFLALRLEKRVLQPLEALKSAFNDTGMSGKPTPIDLGRMGDFQDVGAAYNRLVDLFASEAGDRRGPPCSNCGLASQSGDTYCRSCGFVVGESA